MSCKLPSFNKFFFRDNTHYLRKFSFVNAAETGKQEIIHALERNLYDSGVEKRETWFFKKDFNKQSAYNFIADYELCTDKNKITNGKENTAQPARRRL